MYDQQLQRLELSKAERLQKAEAEAHKNDIKFSKEEVEDHVKRMYNDEIAKSKQKREALEKQYCPTQAEKKISKEHLKETVERLYHVDYEKRDEELFKKYVYPHDPKVVTIDRSEEEAMANRLSTTKGASS
ncbi:hypothetical protein STCU_03198 [Strigomonas culicis]|nr:hypothetical protein STCU_03198 [Strigomonas culicis]|eukprot:EPY31827.1 hypothetical protein STCU_03198 [Strigomonas culicis]